MQISIGGGEGLAGDSRDLSRLSPPLKPLLWPAGLIVATLCLFVPFLCRHLTDPATHHNSLTREPLFWKMFKLKIMCTGRITQTTIPTFPRFILIRLHPLPLWQWTIMTIWSYNQLFSLAAYAASLWQSTDSELKPMQRQHINTRIDICKVKDVMN